MALSARNASPWGLATLPPQSTCHRRRPGPTLAPWCPGGLPACHGAESTRKDPRPEEKDMPMCQKNTFIHRNIYMQSAAAAAAAALCVDILLLLLQQKFCCLLPLFVIVCRMAKFGAGSLNHPSVSFSSFKRDFFLTCPLAVLRRTYLRFRFAFVHPRYLRAAKPPCMSYVFVCTSIQN